MFLLTATQPIFTHSFDTRDLSSASSNSSAGIKILCFASLFSLLAVVIFLVSRITRGGHSCRRRKKALLVVNEQEFTGANITTSQADTENLCVPPNRQPKRVSRLQELRKYLNVPLNNIATVKPILNQRSSISNTLRRSSRLILSGLTGWKQARPVPNHFAAPLCPRTVLLWQIADSIVGPHPHAKPLHARPFTPGHVLSHDRRISFPWIPSKPGAVIVPAIFAANPNLKNKTAEKPVSARPGPGDSVPKGSERKEFGAAPEPPSSRPKIPKSPNTRRRLGSTCAIEKEVMQLQEISRQGLKPLTNLDLVDRATKVPLKDITTRSQGTRRELVASAKV